MPRLPGADFSKIRPSLWLTCRPAFLMPLATAASISSVRLFSLKSNAPESYCSSICRSQNPSERCCQPLNFSARRQLRHAQESAIGVATVISIERKRPDNFLATELFVDQFHRSREFQNKFIERFSGEGKRYARNAPQFLFRKFRLGQILRRELAQSLFAQKAKMNRHDES